MYDIKYVKSSNKIGYISQKANSFNGDFPATVFEVVGAGLRNNMSIFSKYTKEEKEKINEALGDRRNKYEGGNYLHIGSKL